MAWFVEAGDGAKAVELYEELKDKVGCEPINDGIVYGSLMNAYFLTGMEEKAMNCYEEALGVELEVKFGVESYNSVADALGQNGRLDDALNLFERMLEEHDPPLRITIDMRSFSVMVDAYCTAGRFDDAIAVFRRMGEWKVVTDVAAYNNLIRHLSLQWLVNEAELLYKEMGERDLKADEETYVLLMEGCFRVDRIDEGINYFDRMAELELKPDATAYHRLVDGLIGFGMLDNAHVYFDRMREKEISPSIASYEALLKAYISAARLDKSTDIAKDILLDEKVVFSDEMRDLLEHALREAGREGDITKLYEDGRSRKLRQQLGQKKKREGQRALAREEREKRRAEAAAKDEAAARASAVAIEAILGHKRKTENVIGESDANPMDGGFQSRFGITSAGDGALQGTSLGGETEQGNGQLDTNI